MPGGLGVYSLPSFLKEALVDKLDSLAKYIESNYGVIGVPTCEYNNLAPLERREKGVSLFPASFRWKLAKVQSIRG
jgi:hypothetical protein